MQTSQPVRPNSEALLEQYAHTRDPALREQIVEANLYIAQIVARRFSGRGVDHDDLYQVASLALFKAVDRYEPDKGVKFVSFVTPTMAGEVKNYFRDRSRAIRLPRKGVELAQALKLTRSSLEQELGRSPKLDELTQAMNLSEDEVAEALELSNAMSVSSLDAQIAEDEENAPLSRFLGFDDPGFASFEQSDMLQRAMCALYERQQTVIQARFFENRSQRDLEAELGVSQMTVSRIERQALEKLREQIKN